MEDLNVELVAPFIKQNIDLIENGDFDTIYKAADTQVEVPVLTRALLAAGINPLDKLDYIPPHYLCETSVTSFTVPVHITRIGNAAFWSCEYLRNVILPEGLMFIDDDAFAECSNLEQINLPSTLEYIKDDAFAETALKHVVIPDIVKLIPRHCFEACKKLETVKLGKFNYRISARAFSECDNLHEVILNDGLAEIGPYAFADSYALKQIFIPESVIKIQDNPFYNLEDNLTVLCVKNSYAQSWCEDHSQQYELI